MRHIILTIIFTLFLAATAQAVGLQIHTAGTLAKSVTMYAVTASVGTNGTLDAGTPSPVNVASGATTSFKFNANSGYYISSVSGCNGTTYSNSSSGVSTYTYTTGAITGACTVTAVFTQAPVNSCVGTTPYGSNWLRGAATTDPTNRRSFLASISAGGGAGVYNSTLEAWTGSWSAPQALYEHTYGLDDPSCWYETGSGEGSTWNANGASSYGELVVDMQAVRTLARFSVFQMFSDGKTTQVYVYSHANTSSAPANTDAGWVQQGGVITIGAGSYVAPYIYAPGTMTVTPFTTRFLKIRAHNDGSQSSSGYIELKGIKGFSN